MLRKDAWLADFVGAFRQVYTFRKIQYNFRKTTAMNVGVSRR